jgi:CheY-like chemotaxis protein
MRRKHRSTEGEGLRKKVAMSETIKLLIVDDEVQFLESIAKRLELRGFELSKASNGTVALEIAKTELFDLRSGATANDVYAAGEDVLKKVRAENRFPGNDSKVFSDFPSLHARCCRH